MQPSAGFAALGQHLLSWAVSRPLQHNCTSQPGTQQHPCTNHGDCKASQAAQWRLCAAPVATDVAAPDAAT